jgi:ubiquinone/menaquinone biosynthesis C-methylase UbiE
MIEEDIKNFYSAIKFPGSYTRKDLEFHNIYQNKFLELYVSAGKRSHTILEIGCGTGYITNLVALQNPKCKIDAVDFSDSIDIAKEFSKNNSIKNITYHKKDFLNFKITKNYDLVMSNGVLHHIPKYNEAIDIINTISADEMVLGTYNTYGKFMKKLFNVKYINELLKVDQENCPYETSFTKKQFCSYFPNYTLHSIYPGSDLKNLMNYRNGGLTIYHFGRNFG